MPINLMEVRALIPANKSHEIDLALRAAGATEAMFRPYHNGSGGEPVSRMGGNNSAKGQDQQQWLVDHVKAEISVADLRPLWKAAGYPDTIYGALSRAVAQKRLKKVSAGVYKPVAVKHG